MDVVDAQAERWSFLRLISSPGSAAPTGALAHALFELGRICRRGDDERVLSGALAILRRADLDAEVRQEAAFAVGRAAERGDGRAVDALAAALANRWPRASGLRQQAAEGLRLVARPGCTRALPALLSATAEDPDNGVRRDAAHALGQIAVRGDADVLEVLRAQLRPATDSGEACVDVRTFLARALSAVAPPSDGEALAALIAELSAGEAARRAAGEAMAALQLAVPSFEDNASAGSSPDVGEAWGDWSVALERMERRVEELRATRAAAQEIGRAAVSPERLSEASSEARSPSSGRSRSPSRASGGRGRSRSRGRRSAVGAMR